MTTSTQIQTSPPEYRTLPLEFQQDKFHYRQVHRSDRAAVYSQSKNGKILGYEVIKIRRAKGGFLRGALIPPREVYPGSSQWGKFSWTVKTWEGAMERFQLIEAESSSSPSATIQAEPETPPVRPEQPEVAAAPDQTKAPHTMDSPRQVVANQVPGPETASPLVAVPQKTRSTRSRPKLIQQDFMHQLMA